MAAPGKKYLLLKVPDHKPLSGATGASSPDYTTFLRMGTADPNPPMKALLEQVVANGFIDDMRDRGTNHVAASQGTASGTGGAGGPGHTLTTAERVAETNRFLTKGGWHDHTEGNRLTTTLGDKIEIIRGNYKQVVLGRQDALENASERESSGGLDVSGDLAPGSTAEIKWVQDPFTGTWKVTELTEKGDVHEIFHGNVKEEFYGETIESITGSSDQGTLRPGATDATYDAYLPDYETKKTKPKITETTYADTITEKTWASSIESNLGSSGSNVGSIKETTYADSIETHLYGKTEVKEYVGKVGDGVMHILEETHAVNVEERLFCAAETSLAISAAATGLLLTGVHTDIEAAALRVEIKAAGAFFELEAGALYVEIFLGNKFSFFSGTKAEMDNTKLDTAAQALVTAGKYTTVAAAKKSLSAKWSALTFKASIGLGD